MLMKSWSKETIPPLLVQTCTATIKINVVAFQKDGRRSTPGPTYITLEHIPKGCFIKAQRAVSIAALFTIARNSKQAGIYSTD